MEYHYSQSCALCNVEKYFPIAGIFALATWHQSLKVAEQKGMNFNAWKWHCSTTATIHITSVHIENYNFYNGCDDCYLDFKSLRWWGQKIKIKKERKKEVGNRGGFCSLMEEFMSRNLGVYIHWFKYYYQQKVGDIFSPINR